MTENKTIKKKDSAKGLENDLAERYFNCTARERLAFEAGIKLGSLFHQFIGTPISLDNVDALEVAISKSVLVQPFVKHVDINIDRSGLKYKECQYDYTTLSGSMLHVKLVLRYKESMIDTELKYIEDLNYPLMFINGFE